MAARIFELRAKRAKLTKEANEALDRAQKAAEAEGRDLTEAELAAQDDFDARLEALDREIKIEERKADRARMYGSADPEDRTPPVPGSGPQGTPIVDEVTGETAFALERGQSVRQYVERTGGIPAEEHGVSLGGLIQGLVTGKGSPSIMASLDRGATSTGDMTVNSYLAAGVIDLLRARSVAVRAGAMTIPLTQTADAFHFAAIATDPVAEWRSELGAVNQSPPTFRRITFRPQSLACIVRSSRELLEDSANARQAIEMAVSSAFASKVDQVAIWGSGVAPEPKGVASYALESVELPSPLTDYTPITQARLKLLSANAPEPTAAIMSPALETEFGELTDTTGQPLRRPGIIEDVPFLQTMHAPAAGPVVVGHFPYLWLGMRTELRIEVLRELFAGTLEFGLLCHLRMDVALIHEDAFALAAAAGA